MGASPLELITTGEGKIVYLLEQILIQLQTINGKTKLKLNEKFNWKDSITVQHK
jgi:hypothetical protein